MTNKTRRSGIDKPDLSVFRELCKSLDLKDLYEMRCVVTSAIGDVRRKKTKRSVASVGNVRRDFDSLPKSLYRAVNDEDWSDLFTDCDDGYDEYYVYFHTDPRRGARRLCYKYEDYEIDIPVPIYVGMGKRNRAWNFKRTKMHSKMLKELEDYGFDRDQIVHIFRNGLTKSKAMEIESKMILYFGCKTSAYCGKPAMHGGDPVLFNNQYEPYPDKYNELHMCHATV